MVTRNYLKEFQVVVLVGIVAILLYAAIDLLVIASGSPIQTGLLISADDQADMVALPKGVTATALSTIDIEIVRPSGLQRLLFGLTFLPTTLILLLALGLLFQVIRRARRTNPFTTETVRSLRQIGATALLGAMAVGIEVGAKMALNATILKHEFGAAFQFPYVWIFGGFVCFAVAEMIRRGCALRDELESVI